MKHQPNRLYLNAVICILFATGVAAVIAERRLSPKKSAKSSIPSRPAVRTGYPDRILASRLRPQVRVLLDGFGSRLSERGMERVTLVGTLHRAGASQPVVVVHEFPNLFMVHGNQGVLASLNARAAREWHSRNEAERTLTESLFYDSAESFFIAQWRGAATRFLGARSSATEEGEGPLYDVYEVTGGEAARGRPGQPGSRRYFFNSETQLLEIVRYQSETDGQVITVETRYGGWHKVRGQHVPRTVTRLENGHVVLSFASATITLGPRELTVTETPGLSAD